ncbi:sulfate transporter [Streptomyces fumigatiscleroticus]|nr:sulfate transporter [Streptomyces fumigatiscleroticus]
MSTTSPPSFGLTVDTAPGSAVVRITGDLDYETHGELVETVTSLLRPEGTAVRPVTGLRLDFAGLGTVDSSGLSALLLIRRRTGRAGVRLHLDERPAGLERLLEMTGTLEYLTVHGQDGAGGRERPGAG